MNATGEFELHTGGWKRRQKRMQRRRTWYGIKFRALWTFLNPNAF